MASQIKDQRRPWSELPQAVLISLSDWELGASAHLWIAFDGDLGEFDRIYRSMCASLWGFAAGGGTGFGAKFDGWPEALHVKEANLSMLRLGQRRGRGLDLPPPADKPLLLGRWFKALGLLEKAAVEHSGAGHFIDSAMGRPGSPPLLSAAEPASISARLASLRERQGLVGVAGVGAPRLCKPGL